MLAALVTTPWQPQSARAKQRDSLPLRLRLALLAVVALLHLLAVTALLALVERNRRVEAQDAILVDFIDAAPAPPRAPPAAPKPRRRQPMQAVDSPATPLQLYNPDGSLRLPPDLLDRLDEQSGDKRVFSYQIPHMDDAKKYFERHPALVYEGTRFDKYWTPDSDALTSVLAKAVEATTKQVKVKLPGTNGSYVVCTVSILALGGGCGVLTNGADWNGPQDDPDTLNPEEARQCAAWWQQIVGARTQDAWRATRKLYERECRKPLLRQPSG